MYAERGLVKNGIVLKTFNQLYYLFCSIPFTVVIVLLTFLKEDILNNRCSKILEEPVEFAFLRNEGYTHRISLVVLIHLLYFCSSHLVKRKSKHSKKPPAIIGRFQRNILTFKDTVILVTIVMITMMPPYFISNLFGLFNIHLNNSYSNLFLNSVLTFVVGVVFPSYIIYNLENTLPDFFSNSYEAKNNMNFYVRKPYVEPRRGLKFSDISNLQFITWRSKRTQRCFLSDDCKCNKCKVIKPPKIILVNECNEIISM